MQLNDKDRELVQRIVSHWRAFGKGPTLEQLAAASGVAITSIFKRERKLVKYGILAKERGTHRSVIVTRLGVEWAAGRVSTNKAKELIYQEM